MRVATGLSRVTIVAPHGRLDVAIPAEVALADLLPVLLVQAGGGDVDETGRRDGWSLSRLGGAELDSSRTPADLGVRDGEQLYLRPRGDEAPVMVFDDLVYALASGTRERVARWTPQAGRVAGFAAGALVLVAGAGGLLVSGPPYRAAGLTSFAVAAVLLAVAVVFARALGAGRAGAAYGLLAVPYAGVGGLLLSAGDQALADLTVAHLTVATTAAVVTATAASVGVPSAGPIFLAAGCCVVAVPATVGLAARLETGLAGAAAVTAVIAYAALPATAILAYRLAGLPRPPVPTEREQLRSEAESVDGINVLERSRRVNGFLSALLAAIAIVSAWAAVLVAPQGIPGLILASVLGLLPVLRSRWFRTRAQRVPLLGAAAVALGAVAVAVFGQVDQTTRPLVVAGAAIAVVLVSLGVGLTGQRQASPAWGRFLDIIEMLLIIALAPLAVWVSGVLGMVRAIRG
jgi:type VII secretion integral membrane protein EccD